MKENQVEKAYRLTSEMIYKYQLPPGTYISDFTLSKTLGMGRTPVRQAIMILLNHGLIVTAEKGLKVPEITIESIDELYDARICVEPAILRFSMRQEIDKKSIELLRKNVKLEADCNNAKDLIGSLEYDLEFHRILNSLCNNHTLENAYQNIEVQMKKLNVFSLAFPNFDTPRVYSEICDAIENGETETACATLIASIESGRRQKKTAIEKFNSYGLQGIYNFIANIFNGS